MKKIAFVIPWFAEGIPGGAESELCGLVKHLSEYGMELEVLTTCVEQFASDWSYNYYTPGMDTTSNIPIRRFPVKKRNQKVFDKINWKFINNIPVTLKEEDIFLKEMVNSSALYRYISKNKDEYSLFVFIPYMFGTTYFGCQICPEKTILIPCLHDESYAYMTRFKEVFSKIRGMIFHSKPEFQLAESIYDLSDVESSVLGEGLDTNISGDSQRFREKYNIKDDFIIYAGRKDTGKNVDTLINYFSTFLARNPQKIKLVIIGGGYIDIPDKAKNDILDLGYIPLQDKYDAFAASLLLCQPSLNESFSLAIMESWLCGRPVLVHEKCLVTKGFVIESSGGLYFSGYADFEGCLNYFILNNKIANTMGNLGKKFVKDNFTWDIIVDRYICYFKRLSA